MCKSTNLVKIFIHFFFGNEPTVQPHSTTRLILLFVCFLPRAFGFYYCDLGFVYRDIFIEDTHTKTLCIIIVMGFDLIFLSLFSQKKNVLPYGLYWGYIFFPYQ